MEGAVLIYLTGGLVFRLTLLQMHRQLGRTLTPPRYKISALVGEVLLVFGWPWWLIELGYKRAR